MWTFYAVFVAVLKVAEGQSKIIGGQPIDLKRVPFLVSLQYEAKHVAGGCLLTLTHVLSGCHCMGNAGVGMKAEDITPMRTFGFTAMVGTENLVNTSKSKQVRSFFEFLLHPKCSYDLVLVYDFAIGILNESFIQTDRVKPVGISLGMTLNKKAVEKETKALFRGRTPCYVAGWGMTGDRREPSPTLNIVRMRIISDNECRKLLGARNIKYQLFDYGGNAQLCTLSYDKTNASDCLGDSGGPFFCASKIIGTVSYGYECGLWNLPNVYTKLSDAVEWIQEVFSDGVRTAATYEEEEEEEEYESDDRLGRATATGERLTLLMLGLCLVKL